MLSMFRLITYFFEFMELIQILTGQHIMAINAFGFTNKPDLSNQSKAVEPIITGPSLNSQQTSLSKSVRSKLQFLTQH